MAAPSLARADELSLGTITGVFGVKGEVRLFLHNPSTELFEDYLDVTLAWPDGQREVVSLGARPGAGRRIIGLIEGVETVEDAEGLIGAEILIAKDRLPPPEEGAWYHHQILGTPVRTASGTPLGSLAEILPSGDVDIWIVRGLGEERYIPALKANLVDVRPGQEIVVTDGAGQEAL